MDSLQSWIYTVIAVGLAIGVAPFILNKIATERAKLANEKASTKNKILDFALRVAEQVVLIAESKGGTSAEQSKNATDLIQQRLTENNYGNKFTDAQIEQILQAAYISKKVDGSIELSKKNTEEK